METIVLAADAYLHFGRSPLDSLGHVLTVENLNAQDVKVLLGATSPLTLRQNGAHVRMITFEFWEVHSSGPDSVTFDLRPILPYFELSVLLPNHSLSGNMDS